ncbi:MAG: TolC family protein [Bacteroidota bacterium]
MRQRWYDVRRWGLVLGMLTALASGAQAQPVLTLDEALAQALAGNFDVQTALNRLAVAENNVTRGNAGYLPTVSLDGGYGGDLTNTRQTFQGRDPIEVTGAVNARRNAGITAAWTVFDGFARRATYARLETLLDQEEALTEAQTNLIAADVIIGYADLIRQQAQVQVFEDAVTISEERLRIAELRRDLGSASELEVRQARVDLNTDRVALLQQETALANAKTTFNLLLGRPVDQAYAVQDTILVDPSLQADALRQRAEADNPTLRQARAEVRVTELEADEIRAERLPTVDLSTGYDYSFLDSESGFLATSRSFSLSYGLTARYTLFDGLNRRRRLSNAALATEQAERAQEEAARDVRTATATLYRQYATSLELVDLERENLENTRLNVDVALERFRLGTITSVELREVQESLTLAESRLLGVQFAAKQAETELLRLSNQVGR